MKKKYAYLLLACLALFLVDLLGSIASRQFNFNYAKIWPASVAVYVTFGFLLAKNETLLTTVLLTGLLALFDATIGWETSMFLHANTGNLNNHPSLLIWVITAISVVIYGAIVGLLSGGLGKWYFKRKAA